MEINKVITTVRYKGWHLETLLNALAPSRVAVVDHEDDAAVLREVADADVAILCGDLDKRILTGKNLRWVHCDHAGVNHSARQEVFDRGILVTSSAGRSAPVLVEHTFFLLLSLVYHAHAMHEAQKRHVWRGAGNYEQDRGMYGKTMGIIGLGHTGRELAVRAKQFNMHVLGYGRRPSNNPEGVDEYFSMDTGDTIAPLLERSDYLVLNCRLSNETYHMIGTAELQKMKRSALLVNMARGQVVDTNALITALNNGDIAGAGLDVFEQEPLPADSPLWDAKNLVMTPHCTPEMPDMVARCLDIITENIRRYRAGEGLLNQMIPRDLYTLG